jgi:hypothetical protein
MVEVSQFILPPNHSQLLEFEDAQKSRYRSNATRGISITGNLAWREGEKEL